MYCTAKQITESDIKMFTLVSDIKTIFINLTLKLCKVFFFVYTSLFLFDETLTLRQRVNYLRIFCPLQK